jgi:hypothetical protein
MLAGQFRAAVGLEESVMFICCLDLLKCNAPITVYDEPHNMLVRWLSPELSDYDWCIDFGLN